MQTRQSRFQILSFSLCMYRHSPFFLFFLFLFLFFFPIWRIFIFLILLQVGKQTWKYLGNYPSNSQKQKSSMKRRAPLAQLPKCAIAIDLIDLVLSLACADITLLKVSWKWKVDLVTTGYKCLLGFFFLPSSLASFLSFFLYCISFLWMGEEHWWNVSLI